MILRAAFEAPETFNIKDQAMAKVDVPVFDNHSIDCLGLLKEDGTWLIVNTMYTTLREEGDP